MSNQYIVKFSKDANYSESSLIDGFLELISDNGCPTIFVRTCKDSTDPKNVNLLNLYVTRNMGKFNFDHHTLTCTINSYYKYYRIIFDSSSSSAFTDFQKNFETALNSKFDTEYYPKSGNLKYVGEVLHKDTRTFVANGAGTFYYDKPGQKVRYQGEFSEGNFNNLKEFLLNNSEFTNKLKRILHQDSVESVQSSLLKSNKTNLMRGMSDAKTSKDMDLYKFLEIFLKNADVLY